MLFDAIIILVVDMVILYEEVDVLLSFHPAAMKASIGHSPVFSGAPR